MAHDSRSWYFVGRRPCQDSSMSRVAESSNYGPALGVIRRRTASPSRPSPHSASARNATPALVVRSTAGHSSYGTPATWVDRCDAHIFLSLPGQRVHTHKNGGTIYFVKCSTLEVRSKRKTAKACCATGAPPLPALVCLDLISADARLANHNSQTIHRSACGPSLALFGQSSARNRSKST